MQPGFNISALRDYTESHENIFLRIQDGSLFRLTGADEVTFDFSEGGRFELSFKGRGRISGRFLKIIPISRVVMEWDVEGFGRPDERGTTVWITLLENDARTTLTIEHREIPTEESANSKKKAWKEILHGLI